MRRGLARDSRQNKGEGSGAEKVATFDEQNGAEVSGMAGPLPQRGERSI